MTPGQERALRELDRLCAVAPETFRKDGQPQESEGYLQIGISIRLGPMEMREGGLDLREREEFLLLIPPDFPFDYPFLKVSHVRFSGFPHVIWSKWLCLFQSQIEWNPADGLYGYFDRLRIWLEKAALNDMDPVDGPLEPPHHITDKSQAPFIIRANAPVPAGQSWVGLAELNKNPNRVELVGWKGLPESWTAGAIPALAVILPKPLPMEFPKKGGDFFNELLKQGVEREQILRYLAIAAKLAPDDQPIHLVVGIPMRRAPDGTQRLHVAVWTVESKYASPLRSVLAKESDNDIIKSLRQDLGESIFALFQELPVVWCEVFEDRDEIVTRRDVGSALATLSGKRILVLGCGALGSWAAESIARAKANLIHLVDNARVKPGVLARQNFRLEDIGNNKASALADRLKTISSATQIEAHNQDAHGFVTGDPPRLQNYDLILDCTASAIFQMKLERDWTNIRQYAPPIVSFIIDANAQKCLATCIGPKALAGVWDAYVQLKNRVCLDERCKEFVSAFYTQAATINLFQPEPGCSDPTFRGSTADVCGLTASALNLVLQESKQRPFGIAFSTHERNGHPGKLQTFRLSSIEEEVVGQYRIRIDKNVNREVRGWVRQNNRLRSPEHETGGLLWGLWDDAVKVIWVLDVSGPPSDSKHDPGHFVCGIDGTVGEHTRRLKLSEGACGFIGFWHTHPGMPSSQSGVDIGNMVSVVANSAQNQKRALMLIFGRRGADSTAGIYIYESNSISDRELISVGERQVRLKDDIL